MLREGITTDQLLEATQAKNKTESNYKTFKLQQTFTVMKRKPGLESSSRSYAKNPMKIYSEPSANIS